MSHVSIKTFLTNLCSRSFLLGCISQTESHTNMSLVNTGEIDILPNPGIVRVRPTQASVGEAAGKLKGHRV